MNAARVVLSSFSPHIFPKADVSAAPPSLFLSLFEWLMMALEIFHVVVELC